MVNLSSCGDQASGTCPTDQTCSKFKFFNLSGYAGQEICR